MFYRVTRWVLRQLGFAYFRLTVSGLEHIPASGPAVIAGNHPDLVDGILMLIVAPRRVRFLVAEDMFFHPFLRWIFRGMDCIPVYRSRANNGDALRAAYEALRQGDIIGIFPEGTTADLGHMRQIKRGVGLLALKTGAPVVPLGMWGSAEAWPLGARVPRPRRIAMAFAPPVRYAPTALHPVPQELLQRTLEDIRWEIVRTMRWAVAALRDGTQAWWLKPTQVALSALVVVPLSGFLSLTSPPNIEPVRLG